MREATEVMLFIALLAWGLIGWSVLLTRTYNFGKLLNAKVMDWWWQKNARVGDKVHFHDFLGRCHDGQIIKLEGEKAYVSAYDGKMLQWFDLKVLTFEGRGELTKTVEEYEKTAQSMKPGKEDDSPEEETRIN